MNNKSGVELLRVFDEIDKFLVSGKVPRRRFSHPTI